LTSYFKVKVVGKSLIDIEQTLFPALTKMFGGYGNIVKSDYTKPFKIYFESPLFENTVVEILFEVLLSSFAVRMFCRNQ
jgi:hypothetical protein